MALQWRVEFDAEVVFSNGGALQTQGFRLDIPGSDIDDYALGELLIRHLGLLMVSEVKFTRKTLIREPHKGSRGVEPPAGFRRIVDLGEARLSAPGIELPGLVDLPGLVVRVPGGPETVDRSVIAPFDVKGQAIVLHGDGRAQFTEDAAIWLVVRGVALVATDAANLGAAEPVMRGAGIPAITGMRGLDLLPPNNFRLHAVPFPSGTSTSCPVRSYAVVGRD